MNWEATIGIAEIVGAVAIVISLIYVALQVKQSNAQSRQLLEMERSQASREMSRFYSELMATTLDKEFMGIVQQGMADFSGMDQVDKARVAMWISSVESHAVACFIAGRGGLMDEDYADKIVDNFVSFVKTPGLNRWWEGAKPYYQQDLVVHVDKRLAAPDGPAAIHVAMPWLAPQALAE